jgi:hypothetical protein
LCCFVSSRVSSQPNCLGVAIDPHSDENDVACKFRPSHMYTDIAPGNEHPYRMPVAFRIFAGHGSLLDAGAAGETLMEPE